MTDIQTLLGLERPPVAIGFFDSPPAGVPAWTGGPVPAGCTFWKHAQAGHAFYTTPVDHYNCAIGSYVHSITLPEERAGELPQTLGFMVENHYIAMDEVPGIPTLPEAPAVIAYAPAAAAPFAPSVVIVAAQPAQAMVLYEAAIKAGAGGALMNTLGRPGCAALPLSLQTGTVAMSLGCKGNRTFTGLPDGELYLSIPGDKWLAFVDQIATMRQANQAMGDFYAQRQAQFAAA